MFPRCVGLNFWCCAVVNLQFMSVVILCVQAHSSLPLHSGNSVTQCEKWCATKMIYSDIRQCDATDTNATAAECILCAHLCLLWLWLLCLSCVNAVHVIRKQRKHQANDKYSIDLKLARAMTRVYDWLSASRPEHNKIESDEIRKIQLGLTPRIQCPKWKGLSANENCTMFVSAFEEHGPHNLHLTVCMGAMYAVYDGFASLLRARVWIR